MSITHDRTPEQQYATQPRMPSDRPPTKQEVWNWVVHMYGGIFEMHKLQQLAQDKWAWAYIHAVNFDGWRKHPDWVPGDAVIADAVPAGCFQPDEAYFPAVNKFWAIAQAEISRREAA